MPEHKNSKPCIDCGVSTTNWNKHGRCPNCAYEAMRQNIIQRRDKSGEHYKSWKEGMLAHAARLKSE